MDVLDREKFERKKKKKKENTENFMLSLCSFIQWSHLASHVGMKHVFGLETSAGRLEGHVFPYTLRKCLIWKMLKVLFKQKCTPNEESMNTVRGA